MKSVMGSDEFDKISKQTDEITKVMNDYMDNKGLDSVNQELADIGFIEFDPSGEFKADPNRPGLTTYVNDLTNQLINPKTNKNLLDKKVTAVGGTTLEGLEDKKKNFIFRETLLFSVGFSIVFISLGATATMFGSLMLEYSRIFTFIVGVIIIFFSLNMIGLLQFRLLNQELKYHFHNQITKPYMSLLVGIGFGFGWSPCIGPILGSVLALASLETTLRKGIILFSIYVILY